MIYPVAAAEVQKGWKTEFNKTDTHVGNRVSKLFSCSSQEEVEGGNKRVMGEGRERVRKSNNDDKKKRLQPINRKFE